LFASVEPHQFKIRQRAGGVAANDARRQHRGAARLARDANVVRTDKRNGRGVGFAGSFRRQYNCLDVLINNAGVNHNTAFLLAADLSIAREEFECNYLAPLRVTRAFAPALIANKGAVLNMLTILARVNLPFMGSYCASKAAALSLTQGLRAELGPKGVRVAAALPGAVDTRMTAGLPIPKMSPADAATEILDGFESGEEEIYVGDMARGLAEGLAKDPKGVERQLASPN